MAADSWRDEKLKAGKFNVDVPLVRRLIAAQFPQWANLPIRPVVHDGWDNWTFHLGDRMKVRLPSGEGYVEQAGKEAKWLPRLAPHLPVRVPAPVGIGQPGKGYPWSWSVYDWIDGEPATRERVGDLTAFATDVAGFLNALQSIDPVGGPPPGQHNYFRGASVTRAYGDEARQSVGRLDGRIDAAAAHAVLNAAEAVPFAGPPVWVHGDIAIGNFLVRDGRLVAAIDFGCLAVGDPACDLVIAWLFFSGESRAAFRSTVQADQGMWVRARGWALWKAALVLANGSPTNPDEAPPLRVIEEVLAEARG